MQPLRSHAPVKKRKPKPYSLVPSSTTKAVKKHACTPRDRGHMRLSRHCTDRSVPLLSATRSRCRGSPPVRQMGVRWVCQMGVGCLHSNEHTVDAHQSDEQRLGTHMSALTLAHSGVRHLELFALRERSSSPPLPGPVLIARRHPW